MIRSHRVTQSTAAKMEPVQPSERPSGDGRIPFTLRVGVTGHRDPADPNALRVPIRQVLSRLRELVPVAPGAGLTLVVVSSLAEGADRLVAEEVLADCEARLEVALPMPAEDYAEDFMTEGSRQEFFSFLHRASDVWQALPSLSREEAYERAGHYMVDRCDALIALWDGERSRGRGGTAEIVAYAQEQGVPIAWVHTKGEPVVDYAFENIRAEVVIAAARKLRLYNSGVIDSAQFDRRVRDLRAELMPDMTRAIPIDPVGLSRETVAEWVFPYFIRADIMALRYQRRYRSLSGAIFALAALAVGVAAVQANFWPWLNWLGAFEVLCLAGLLLILEMNRRWRLHDQWISCRFLAERLRSGYFLALAQTGDRRGRSARIAYYSDSTEAWIERALTEVSARRPALSQGPAPVTMLRDYLNRYWIGGQITYYEKTSWWQGRNDELLVRATASLFALSLIAATIHIAGSSLHLTQTWENILVVVSIAVPAIGVAFHGVGVQRQPRRNSGRYRTMVGVLTQVKAQMAEASTLEQVRQVACEMEHIMREENSDWFGVMRFHDMELIT